MVQKNFLAGEVFSHEVRIRSLAKITGVVTVTESGAIYAYNANFFQELLGMQFGEAELLSTNIMPVSDILARRNMVGIIVFF